MLFRLRQTLAFVERERADRNMLIVILGFALTVALTRLFLQLSGYPQLGNAELHIAHLLYGGLALFVGTLIAIIFDHRHVYPTVAALSGIGIGLFIDEVGKFISQSNDYFFPVAAPIIYGVLLLTVLLYLAVRRPDNRSPRSELYHAFEIMKEALDHQMDKRELAELQERLARVSRQTLDPNLANVAHALFDAVSSDQLSILPITLSPWQRLRLRWHAFEARWYPLPALKVSLVVGLIVLSGLAVVQGYYTRDLFLNISTALPRYIEQGALKSAAQAIWFLISVSLDGVAGIAMLLAAILFFLRERAALTLGIFSLVFSLTTADVIGFYFRQFGAYSIFLTSFQVLILLGLIRFRRRQQWEMT
ncbi:MAG: hypothetical protein HY327_04930 [Chloroflexi bacterium]|nr:hypothetical protein [Chloroflexota bacterium]